MSFESSLDTQLRALCPRVFPDVAPLGTPAPYVTWQEIGGRSLRFLDNSPGDKRNVLLQLNVWDARRVPAMTLIRQIEDALCASGAFIAVPSGEPMGVYEDDTQLYGCIQRFSIFAAR